MNHCWFCKSEAVLWGAKFRKAYPTRHKIEVFKEHFYASRNSWFRVYNRKHLIWKGTACCGNAAKVKAFHKYLDLIEAQKS